MSSTTDHLANLARPAVGPAVLSLVEDQWFDRKSIRIDAPKLAKTIVALANAEGGVIVVGVHAGRVEGTDALATHRNSLMQASLDHTEPPARIHSRLIECVNDRGGDDHLLVVTVDTSDVVHATKADECYLRVGDEDRKLRFAQRQELIYDKGQSHFDGTLLADVTVADLDLAAVEAYAAEIGSSASDRALQARALVTSQGAITTAAYLLFGVRPQDRLPEAYVRVLRFEGLERQTGSRLNLRDDIRCEGNLTEMIEAASAQVERLQPTRTALGGGGRFERRGLIPHDAWLEGIVNAVVHRSYSIGGDHIRVEIYDDRIEITSPGRFPGVTRVDDMRDIPRFARNPRIARACADLRFGRELGEGIKRIYDEMRAAGLIDPVYRQTPASVKLVLAATPLNPEVAEQLPSRSGEVMEHIRSSGGLSTGDIADAVGLSKPATLLRLRALQEAGLIEWVGKSPKDPRAYWKLHSK
jgi:ATP-dependent DNA helicase RecG